VVAVRLAGVERLPALMMVLYPSVIAPLFNKFTPLPTIA
jgi:hypothetical protein